MTLVRPVEIYGEAFQSYAEPFSVKFPTSGLTLIRGLNEDTGDTSDSGKSTILRALQYLYGGCKTPATRLQCDYTDRPMYVGGALDTPSGKVVVVRKAKGGLTLTAGGETFRGAMAEEALTKAFGGLDADQRAAATYCRQGSHRGLFLSLSDADKCKAVAKLVPGLSAYQAVSEDAQKALAGLERAVAAAESNLKALRAAAAARRDAAATAEAARGQAEEKLAACGDLGALERAEAETKAEAAGLWDNCRVVPPPQANAAVERAAVASIDSEIDALRSVQEPDAVRALREELAEVEYRRNRVQDAEAERRVALERDAGEARTAVARAEAAVKALAGAPAKVAKLEADLAELERATCYTCGQAWTTAGDAAAALRVKIAEAEVEVTRGVEAAGALVAARAALAGVQKFEPHPWLAQLEAARVEKQREVDAAVRAFASSRDAEVAALSEKKRAILDTLNAKARAEYDAVKAEQAKTMAAVEAAQARHLAAARAVSAARMLAGEAERAAYAAGRAISAALAADRDAAAAQGIYDAARAKYALESDVAALAGRKGFLGRMVRDVLGQVEDVTNEILLGIPNVRDVQFRFDPDPEVTLITPTVVVRGEEADLEHMLSGGQGTAVARAVDLAFGTVVAEQRGAYPGWLSLDESFDGLGAVSKEGVLEMLARFAPDRLVLCIDHSSEAAGLFSQVIETRTTGGRSRIV